jgi:hypothetical protein
MQLSGGVVPLLPQVCKSSCHISSCHRGHSGRGVAAGAALLLGPGRGHEAAYFSLQRPHRVS